MFSNRVNNQAADQGWKEMELSKTAMAKYA